MQKNLSWAVLSILGVSDYPIAYGKEHGFVQSGENDLILFMNGLGDICVRVSDHLLH